MYTKHTLQTVTYIKTLDHWDQVDEKDIDTNKPIAILPHSCGDWIIGGTNEVEALIKDLQDWLVDPPTFIYPG